MRILDALLAVGAATRLTRFIVTEDAGRWLIKDPANRWADRPNGEEDTPRQRLVSGLDCPFCVGTWLQIGGLALSAVLPARGSLRTAYRVVAGGLTASWLAGHVGSRLGDAGYDDADE